jgi:hypothetical protein
MQHTQNKIADNRIEKTVAQEKSPPRFVIYTRSVNNNALKTMRDYQTGKRQKVGNPVTKRAIRLQPVSNKKTFDKRASKYDTQNDSCGNPQEKVLVVSLPARRTNSGTRTENLCPSHFAHATFQCCA